MSLHARVPSSSQWAEMNQPIHPQRPATAQRLPDGVRETRTGPAFRSHAQSLEDAALWKALRDIRAGQYVDIGAYHPLRDSVSAGFYERGWRGINVDPLPGLSALYAEQRPDEPFIAAAISNRAGPLILARIEDTGLSAIDGPSADKVRVDTMALTTLFDRLSGPVHWMKIDVEGHEAAVIDSWGDHPARPWILCIECDEGAEPDWHSALIARDYQYVRSDGLNRFYLHRSQARRMSDLGASPGIRDHILITQWSGLSEIPGQLVSLTAERDSMKTIMDAQDRALDDHRFAIEAGNKAQAHLNRHIDRLDGELREARAALAKQVESAPPSPTTDPDHLGLQTERLETERLETARHETARLAFLARRSRIASQSHEAAMGELAQTVQADMEDLASLRDVERDLRTRQGTADARIIDLEAQLAGLRAREAHLVEEIGRHRDSLEALKSSTYWRIGAPLRHMLRAGRGMLSLLRGSPGTVSTRLFHWGLDLAVTHWRRDYKWMRPLRLYVLARPRLGRRLSMRPDHWDESWNEVDPFDPDPTATQLKLVQERAADPNPARYKGPPPDQHPDALTPGRSPRPTLFAEEDAVRALTRALRRVQRGAS